MNPRIVSAILLVIFAAAAITGVVSVLVGAILGFAVSALVLLVCIVMLIALSRRG